MAKASVDVDVVDAGFTSELKRMQEEFGKFAEHLSRSVVYIGEYMALYMGIGAFQGTVEGFEAVYQASQRMNDTAENVQKVTEAAQESGMTLAQLETLMGRLDITVAQQAAGLKDTSQYWNMLNINAQDFVQLNMPQKMEALATGFAHAQEKGEGLLALHGLMGKSASELIPLLARGSEGIDELMNKVGTATEGEVSAMHDLDEEASQLGTKFKVAMAFVVEGLVTGIGMVELGFRYVVEEGAWAFSKLTGFGTAYYNTLHMQNSQMLMELKEGIQTFEGIDPETGKPKTTTEDDNRRKRQAEAEASLLDEDIIGDKKAKKLEEKHEKLEATSKKMGDAALQRADRLNNREDADEETDPQKKRGLLRITAKDDLQDQLNDLNTKLQEGTMLIEEYRGRWAEAAAQYNHKMRALAAEDKKEDEKDLKERETLRLKGIEELVKGEEAENKKSIREKTSALQQLAGQELNFDVDSFRARGGSGGLHGVGTGGNVQSQMRLLEDQLKALGESNIHLKNIEEHVGKVSKGGKKFQ